MATKPSADLLAQILDNLWESGLDDHLASIQIGLNYDISTVGLLRVLLANAYDRDAVAGDLWDTLFSGHSPPASAPWLPALLHSSYPWPNADTNITRSLANAIASSADTLTLLEEWSKNIFNRFLTPFRFLVKRTESENLQTAPYEPTMQQAIHERDGPQCLITGLYDQNSEDDISVGAEVGATLKVVYILPSICATRATMLRYLEMFSGNRITASTFSDENINCLSNGFLLQDYYRNTFNKLLWGIECQEDHQTGSWTYRAVQLNEKETFSTPLPTGPLAFGLFQQQHSTSPEHHPLPNPHLCNIHCAVGRILHLTGAADIFARLEHDTNNRQKLWLDGTDAMHWVLMQKLEGLVDT